MFVPAIVAASPTRVRYLSSSFPGLMPAATAAAAVVAASSIPNAVPFTAVIAFAMMVFTSFAEFPSPVSFAFASSIWVILDQPLWITIPARAVVAIIAGFVIKLVSFPPTFWHAFPIPSVTSSERFCASVSPFRADSPIPPKASLADSPMPSMDLPEAFSASDIEFSICAVAFLALLVVSSSFAVAAALSIAILPSSWNNSMKRPFLT